MGPEQQRLLAKMKYLVRKGKRRIIYRKDRNIEKDLRDIGIDENDMWKHIGNLKIVHYYEDPKPYYLQSINSLTFIKKINDCDVYIKLILEKDLNDELVLCLSFHKSERRNKYV